MLLAFAFLVDGDDSSVKPTVVKVVKGKNSDYFQEYLFENLFSKQNSPMAHATGFWVYHSFITAATEYQTKGFGTTSGKLMRMKEVAAFLGHIGSTTSCGYGVATGGRFAWGLCNNKESTPGNGYCEEYFKYMNYHYGKTGEALKANLLDHPEYIEQNATLAFQVAIWRWWMTPATKHQPSAHSVFFRTWKHKANHTLVKRVPGFGTTMNVMYREEVCGKGEDEHMNNMVSHYLYYLNLMGVGREEAGPRDLVSCAEQEALKPPSWLSSS